MAVWAGELAGFGASLIANTPTFRTTSVLLERDGRRVVVPFAEVLMVHCAPTRWTRSQSVLAGAIGVFSLTVPTPPLITPAKTFRFVPSLKKSKRSVVPKLLVARKPWPCDCCVSGDSNFTSAVKSLLSILCTTRGAWSWPVHRSWLTPAGTEMRSCASCVPTPVIW